MIFNLSLNLLIIQIKYSNFKSICETLIRPYQADSLFNITQWKGVKKIHIQYIICIAKIMINFGQSYHLKKLSNSGLNYMYYISLKKREGMLNEERIGLVRPNNK